MLCVLDRFLTDDLCLTNANELVELVNLSDRVRLLVYKDDPYYLSIFLVDDVPILKEEMVDDVWGYIRRTSKDDNLYSFLIEYAR